MASLSFEEITSADRIESLKAGGFGAIAGGFGFLIITGFHLIWRYTPFANSGFIPVYGIGIGGLISGAIAVFSGFLFGVTYRYIIRTDSNSHLKSGAVGAFGLVRGLSQLDMGLFLHGNRWMLALLIGESIMMFAIAQIFLDISFRYSWVKPLSISSPETNQASMIIKS